AGGQFRHSTNVFRLNHSIHYQGKDDVPQIVFYFAGVGTRGDWTANATAQGIDQIIREAYVTLASNYNPGDEIYLFGYSRGGIAARALAGMLAPGLLSGDNLDRLWAVWELFLNLGLSSERQKDRLRDSISPYAWPQPPKVEFLGLFDSVPGTSH